LVKIAGSDPAGFAAEDAGFAAVGGSSPMAESGLALTVWAARAAVGCYAGRVWMDVAGVGSPGVRRWVWTAGLGFLLAHVAAAFGFVHGWSHAAAYRETARQTAAVTGLDWGVGLWVNDAFLLLWAADAGAWWAVGAAWPRRFRRTYLLVQGVFAFLMFNATAVFGPEFWRAAAAGFGLAVAGALVLRARRGAKGDRG
jgi:hypothetical protein